MIAHELLINKSVPDLKEWTFLKSFIYDAYYWLARIYSEASDHEQAIRNYQKVLDIEPDNYKSDYWLKETQWQLKAKQ